MVYDLPVDDEKVKPHQITTLHLVCALAFIVAGSIIFRYNFVITGWGLALLLAGIALAIIVIAKNKWATGKVNTLFRVLELLISLTIAIYSLTQHWKFPAGIFGVLSAALIFALYTERDAGKPLTVQLDDSGIKLPPTARKRFLQWTEVEQVVIRFGTISIDCADNRLFQWNLTGPATDNEIFEAWAAARVEEHRDKRRKDDW